MSLHSAGRHAVDPGAVTESGHLRGLASLSRGRAIPPNRTTAYTEGNWISQDSPVQELEASTCCSFQKKKKTAYRRAHEGPTTGVRRWAVWPVQSLHLANAGAETKPELQDILAPGEEATPNAARDCSLWWRILRTHMNMQRGTRTCVRKRGGRGWGGDSDGCGGRRPLGPQ